MPWTDLIMACVEFKISEADFMDPNSEVLCDFYYDTVVKFMN